MSALKLVTNVVTSVYKETWNEKGVTEGATIQKKNFCYKLNVASFQRI